MGPKCPILPASRGYSKNQMSWHMQNKFLIYKSQVQCEFFCVWFYYHKQLVATLCISDHLNLNAPKCFGRKEMWNFWNSKGKLANSSDYSQIVINCNHNHRGGWTDFRTLIPKPGPIMAGILEKPLTIKPHKPEFLFPAM